MFSVIRKIIEGKGSNSPTSQEDLEQKKHVAAGALLLEAAHVDNECTDAEMEHIIQTLKDKFELSDQCVAELLELSSQGREQAVDLWQFTNHINKHFSIEEKLAVMEDVWRIILLDGRLEKHEDHYVHKLANLLRLNHKQLIDAKLRAREQVEKG